jgi:magnesium transporter
VRTCQVSIDGRPEPAEDISAALVRARAAGSLLWVELDHPDAADFVGVAEALGLHPLSVEDAVHARGRPKLDVFDEQQFCSLITLHHRDAAAPLEAGRVMVFVGPAFVVTVRREAGDTLQRARSRLRLTTERPTGLDVLHAVTDTVVDDLGVASGLMEGALLASAERLFGPQRSDEAHALYQATRQLIALAHAIQPLIEPLRHLSSGAFPGADLEVARQFQDVLDHALVVDREINDHSQLVEHLRSSNDSSIALQQNTDMRKIAAWAAVIAVPTAVTGFFGMNVPYPGFGAVSGVVAAVILQLVLAVTLLVVFRRRRWL